MTASHKYKRYLESYTWYALCRAKIFRDGGLSDLEKIMIGIHGLTKRTKVCCEACHRRVPRGLLHVHHTTYDNVFHESLDDLALLCAGCHAKQHGLPTPIWWECVNRGDVTMEDVENAIWERLYPIRLATAEALEWIKTKQTDRLLRSK